MKRVLILAGVVAILVAPAASAGDSFGVRTSKVFNAMRKCSDGIPLVASVLQTGDPVQASEAVNLVKDGCAGLRRKVLGINDDGFEDAAVNAWASLDYWERGLGRISDYIDFQRPSDASTAKTYFARARSSQRSAIVGLNAARRAAGLKPFPVK